MTEPDPTVRGQELGEALRGLRERAGLSLADAAKRIDASASKLSRLENGKRAAPIEDVAALLAVYGTTGRPRTQLLGLAREVGERGWWQRNRPSFAERQNTLVSLESRALTITNFEGMTVPGLLQTGEYTRSLMIECGHVPENEVEARMVTRLRRHSILRRQSPPGLVAIIDELALHRLIGGPDVLRRQLDHLVELATYPNIELRVVPNDGSAHAGINGAFTVLRRPEGTPVVFLENLTSSLFLEERHEIARYEYATRELLARALDAAQSVRRIAMLARRLDAGGRQQVDDVTALNWRKSSYSGSQENCVEAAHTSRGVLLRDSKNPEGGHLTVSPRTLRNLPNQQH
ncbi:Transcriptional regulator, contains XRE-family HTH domain [Amycolatopsis marina]|uniref:Transcriptional regulator, contains XRE-family HTH domain n=1 Tax=Amycolatopsis marina TaxID=490629 RepID=A0A1I0Z983_9PSEU|nr:Scr1 family TA system antitoxin-like transcriptional regulator [Amycolatopsis marina]SFB20783.1 Transcriptional regulator, contains XRE-family HTH domain [Amycolatopsis marina]